MASDDTDTFSAPECLSHPNVEAPLPPLSYLQKWQDACDPQSTPQEVIPGLFPISKGEGKWWKFLTLQSISRIAHFNPGQLSETIWLSFININFEKSSSYFNDPRKRE